MKPTSQKRQKAITPALALKLLQEGNERFIKNLKLKRNYLQQQNQTSKGQYPFAVILSCIDSRTSVELIFDQGLGDVLSIRIAGNILNDDILGSMEFGCKIAGSKIIVVLGHTSCGAIEGASQNLKLGYLTGLLQKIKPAFGVLKRNSQIKNNQKNINKATERNVINTVSQIKKSSPLIRQMLKNKEIGLIGGIHDLSTGQVRFLKKTKSGL